MSYAEGAQGLKFLKCEDFAERVMAGQYKFFSMRTKAGMAKGWGE